MRGRLNLFQAAMLRWRELAPYNAVHVAELAGPLDPARLTAAVGAHLAALGVTGFVLDAERRRYDYGGGPQAADMPVLAGGDDPARVLEQEMERQLNLPFPAAGAYVPFRFFAVDAGATFHLGVAYDHFIAGGDSIVALVKGIACRYEGTGAAGFAAPELYPPAYARLFFRNAGKAYLGQYSLPAMLRRSARAFRPRYPHGDDFANAFTSFELTAPVNAAVIRAAGAWGLTRNDLLIALLLKSLAPEVPDRLQAKRRREIAIASVINIRGEFGMSPDAAFGQFLSSFLVSHPVPADASIEALARDVHEQTRRVKRRKLYLQTLHLLAWGGLAWRFMTPGQRRQMYAKNYPVWAGVSMLSVESLWRDAAGQARVLHYLRAISTGPFSPMVIAPASVGDCLHIGVSYRTAAFRREDIDRIVATFVATARSLG